MASWRKRIDARLQPLGSRVRVSVTPCRFRGGRNGVWVGFCRVSPVFPCHKFDSTIFLHSLLTFNYTRSLMVRQAWSADILLITDLQYSGFIASHPSTRSCVGHEFSILLYFRTYSCLHFNFLLHSSVKCFILTNHIKVHVKAHIHCTGALRLYCNMSRAEFAM